MPDCGLPEKLFLAIGVDGMRGGDTLEAANCTVMQGLANTGAYSCYAHTVYPTYSEPTWSAIFYGDLPQNTGQGLTNEGKHIAPPPNGTAVHCIDHIKAHGACLQSAAVYTWSYFQTLFNTDRVDQSVLVETDTEVVNTAISWIDTMQLPAMVFLHFDSVDHIGHDFSHSGFGGSQYRATLKSVDDEIGRLLDALDERGLLNRTAIAVTGDHGGMAGIRHSHTLHFAEEVMTVPFIYWTADFQTPHRFDAPVMNLDLSAMAVKWFDVPPPPQWRSKLLPISEGTPQSCQTLHRLEMTQFEGVLVALIVLAVIDIIALLIGFGFLCRHWCGKSRKNSARSHANLNGGATHASPMSSSEGIGLPPGTDERVKDDYKV